MCGLPSAPQADQHSMLPVISRLNALVWFVDLVNFRRAIKAPVLAADQPLREGVLAGVGGKTGGGHLGGTFCRFAPRRFRLGSIEGFAAHGAGMIVLKRLMSNCSVFLTDFRRNLLHDLHRHIAVVIISSYFPCSFRYSNTPPPIPTAKQNRMSARYRRIGPGSPASKLTIPW